MNLLNKKHVEMGFIQEPPESSIYGKNFTITLNEKKTRQGKNTITINFKGSVFEIVQSDQNRFFEMFLIAYTGDKKFINLKAIDRSIAFSQDAFKRIYEPLNLKKTESGRNPELPLLDLLTEIYKKFPDNKTRVREWFYTFKYMEPESILKYILIRTMLCKESYKWLSIEYLASEDEPRQEKLLYDLTNELNELSYEQIFGAKHPAMFEMKNSILFFNALEGIYIHMNKKDPDIEVFKGKFLEG